MALVKCPDCGRMVSSRASSCPDCGCPARFFVSDSPSNSEKKDVVAKTKYDSKIFDNTTTQVESIKYSILGNDIICYKGDYETLAKYCGYFYNLAENAEKKLIIEYYKCTNIEKALIDVPKLAKDIMSNAIDVAMGVFYDMGLTMSVEQFLEKYYYSNNMDYDTYYDKVVENYSEIVELRDNLKEYRALQKANRGKWQGGGFGVKGAIKGAVTASMLNGASSFFHSFGDAMRKYSDDKKIKNALKALYEDDNTKIELCCSIKQCIMNVYYAFRKEIIEIRHLDPSLSIIDRNKASVLFDNAIRYAKDEKAKIHDILNCISLDPVNRRYYNDILANIYVEIKNTGNLDFFNFLSYWGLEELYKNNIGIKPVDTDLYNEMDSLIQEDIIKKDNKNSVLQLKYIDIDLLNTDDLKRYYSFIKLPFIGNKILFDFSDFVMTDLILCFADNCFYLDEINKLELSDIEDEKSFELKVIFDGLDNKENYYKSIITKTENDSISLQVMVYLFNAVKDGAQYLTKWKDIVEEINFIKKCNSMQKYESLQSIDDYLALRYWIYELVVKKKNNLLETKDCQCFIKKMTNMSYGKRQKIATDLRLFKDIYKYVPKKEFIRFVSLDRSFGLAPKRLLILNDEEDYTIEPIPIVNENRLYRATISGEHEDVTSKFVSDEKNMVIASIGNVEFFYREVMDAFAVSENGIFFIRDKITLKASSIRSIEVVNKNKLVFSDGIRIYSCPVERINEYNAVYLCRMLKIYFNLYSGNSFLENEDTSADYQNKSMETQKGTQKESNNISLDDAKRIFEFAQREENDIFKIPEIKNGILQSNTTYDDEAGILTLTPDRIIFLSATKEVNIPISKIKSVATVNDGSYQHLRIGEKGKFLIHCFYNVQDMDKWKTTINDIKNGRFRGNVNMQFSNNTYMYCPFCGKQIERNAKFCNFCGENVVI